MLAAQNLGFMRKDENGEPLNDGQRFDMAVRQIVGKRLTYKQAV